MNRIARILYISKKLMVSSEKKYYHGTSQNFKVGDLLKPPSKTSIISEKGRKKNLDKVFFTTDIGSAKIYAGRAKNALGGISKVYEIEPIGKIEELHSKKGTSVYFSNGAKIIKEINSQNKTAKELNQDYMGQHSAPTKGYGDEPIYSVDNTYPKIYESGGSEYSVMSEDREGLNIILSVHNKPNAKVTVYRAVPNINKHVEKKLKGVNDAKQSLIAMKEHRAIKKSTEAKNIIYNLMDKYPIEKHTYDEQQDLMIKDLEDQYDKLESQLKQKIKIEKGNWVTPNIAYAKLHGIGNLNNKYKIVRKTVRAKDLYTDGNSLSEWGYDPQ